jgi:hypothetical protein
MDDGRNGLLPIPPLAWKVGLRWSLRISETESQDSLRPSLRIRSFGHHPGVSGLHNNAKSTLRPLACPRIVLGPSLVWLGSPDKTEALERKYERLF